MVTRAFERTHCHLHLYRLVYKGRFGEESVTEHRKLVDALTAGEPDAAEAAMRQHLINARDRVLAGIENGNA
jgi:DNA-binding GntR family transcriptional regulator